MSAGRYRDLLRCKEGLLKLKKVVMTNLVGKSVSQLEHLLKVEVKHTSRKWKRVLSRKEAEQFLLAFIPESADTLAECSIYELAVLISTIDDISASVLDLEVARSIKRAGAKARKEGRPTTTATLGEMLTAAKKKR